MGLKILKISDAFKNISREYSQNMNKIRKATRLPAEINSQLLFIASAATRKLSSNHAIIKMDFSVMTSWIIVHKAGAGLCLMGGAYPLDLCFMLTVRIAVCAQAQSASGGIFTYPNNLHKI